MTDRVPQINGEALGATNGGDGIGAVEQQGQSVAQNRAPSPEKGDSKGVAKSLWVRKGGRGDGVKNGSFH